MDTKQALEPGNFTGLAKDYSLHRPDYCPSVTKALLALFDKNQNDLDVADVGAGTGIWSRMIYKAGVKSLVAIEPNDDMRTNGEKDSFNLGINWSTGSAEKTGLKNNSVDWITMASSFHWADFNTATKEFARVLRAGGRFTALWNPRLIEVNPLLQEIEAYLNKLRPEIKRVSSGRSGITETLTEKLWNCGEFQDVVYLEGRHVINMTRERYIGAWRSVNDLQAQLGPTLFENFLDFVDQKTASMNTIEATYLTRAWSAQRKD